EETPIVECAELTSGDPLAAGIEDGKEKTPVVGGERRDTFRNRQCEKDALGIFVFDQAARFVSIGIQEQERIVQKKLVATGRKRGDDGIRLGRRGGQIFPLGERTVVEVERRKLRRLEFPGAGEDHRRLLGANVGAQLDDRGWYWGIEQRAVLPHVAV